VGVTLHADGNGGIQKIAGSVHYLQPDGSSLVSRGVIALESVRAEGLKRVAPEMYAELRKSKYIQGSTRSAQLSLVLIRNSRPVRSTSFSHGFIHTVPLQMLTFRGEPLC
jgi:hypothetical protein